MFRKSVQCLLQRTIPQNWTILSRSIHLSASYNASTELDHTSSHSFVPKVLEEGDLWYEPPPYVPPWYTKAGSKVFYAQFKVEINLLLEEIKEWLQPPPSDYRTGETDIVWKFNDEKSVKHWRLGADSDFGIGRSSCNFELTQYKTGLFYGQICTELPEDARIVRTGYCLIRTPEAIKSFGRRRWYDWEPYNILVVRARGDGRSYMLNIHCKGYCDGQWYDIYQYPLYTRGGPYWQTTRIPFSKFIFSPKGRVQDRQWRLDLENISGFGITIGDKIDGPFALEIDYIGLEYDVNMTEEFAYESYEVPAGVIQT